jgi:hypothetical protein
MIARFRGGASPNGRYTCGPGSRSIRHSRTSATTPTTVIRTVSPRHVNQRPIGSSPGQYRSAIALLTTATEPRSPLTSTLTAAGACVTSVLCGLPASSKVRPLSRRIPIALK